MCADGCKQQNTSNISDAISPTVSTESVLITIYIDAYENQDIPIVDAPGALLTADMDE